MPIIQRVLILSAILCGAPALAQQSSAPASTPPAAAPAAAVPAPAVAAAPAPKLDTIPKLKQALGAVDTAKGTTLDLPADKVFEFNQAGVRIEAAPLLQNLADLLRKTKQKVVLTGHTDNKGDAGYDKKLSEMRAKALKGALVQRGIAPGSISTAGVGQENPKQPNTHPDGSDDPAGREANRRIEVMIMKR